MQARLIITIVLMVLLPPFALLLGGRPLASHFHLPPGYEYQTGGAFSPLGTTLLCLTAGALILLTGFLLSRRESKSPLNLPDASHRRLPRRAWAGLALLVAGGGLAAVAGAFIGAALMLVGATLLLDGDTWRRSGGSLMTVDRRYFLALLPLGLLPGWGAEYLNRFVELWSVPAAGDAVSYLLGVSLLAMALLPAAVVARQWLAVLPGVQRFTRSLTPLPVPGERTTLLLLGLGVAGLLGGTLWPEELYAAAWLAPVALLAGVHLLTGGTPPDGARWLPAMGGGLMAGLILGAATALADDPWHLHAPFAGYGELGETLLAGVLFAAYGLAALMLGDWLAPSRQGKVRPRRRFAIPIRVEPPAAGKR